MIQRFIWLLFLSGGALTFTNAFISPYSRVNSDVSSSFRKKVQNTSNINSRTPAGCTSSSSTAVYERRWNFNQGRGPFGLKKNAEIWNGRVAQMAFVIVLLQELITGKGVIASIQDGDTIGYAGLGLFIISVVGLTGWLISKGDESDIIF